MCDPISIAGATAMAGGTLMNQQAARKEGAARRAALDAERIRQNAYTQEATARFNETLAGSSAGAAQGDEVRARGDRERSLGAMVSDGEPAIPTGGAGAPAVVGEEARVSRKMSGKGADFARRLAAMGAPGEAAFSGRIDRNRSAIDLSNIGGFAAGSANVLPLELAAALNAGRKKRAMADILNQAGGMAFMYGANGGTLPDIFGPKAPLPPHLTAPGMPSWSTAGVF